ncbi:hypothetical protein [Kordiimonas gwangyangensis]|uniref:hypothetical protein n=1 Tax=Kordiimonas gwangyangensis TaxID=288022 RepID=UPI00036DCAC8|nr:hypothetical protein [Kordiimonas gwangyangensis]
MDYPIIIDFDMRKARLLRASFYLGIATLVGIVGWAIFTGQERIGTVAAVFGLLIILFLFLPINHYFLKPRFKCPHALEIHADHLVWATADGPFVIPRQAVLSVIGGDKLQWGGVVHVVELEVTPDYCVRSLYGSAVTPSLEQEFANGHTEVSVSIALENWLRDRPSGQ